MGVQSRIKMSPERAEQVFCIALSGLISFSFSTQGFGRFATSTLGYDVPRFQRWGSLSHPLSIRLLQAPDDIFMSTFCTFCVRICNNQENQNGDGWGTGYE
jgi:hypothetical protein